MLALVMFICLIVSFEFIQLNLSILHTLHTELIATVDKYPNRYCSYIWILYQESAAQACIR